MVTLAGGCDNQSCWGTRGLIFDVCPYSLEEEAVISVFGRWGDPYAHSNNDWSSLTTDNASCKPEKRSQHDHVSEQYNSKDMPQAKKMHVHLNRRQTAGHLLKCSLHSKHITGVAGGENLRCQTGCQNMVQGESCSWGDLSCQPLRRCTTTLSNTEK